ncbi:hypothetical protein [Nostoc sp. NMS4]|uniref:hypothetical protein n=1 Tax=Nostoc sp. NMS4 TaxID=2815390 RepID=UPI0025CFCE5E|nr:hypothetical protein [Nostoc sp. NMS4]MBN3926288.1 hypothetical protein [Nostoc sp. NMS4]
MEKSSLSLSQNRFDANIQGFPGLLNSNQFAAELEILVLLIAAHYDNAFSSRRYLLRITPTLNNDKFLYYT